MGCLKLSYCSDATLPKVMYGKSVLSEKSVQIWISVDPMSDKYPSLTPYNYCANNPIRITDPNGMEWEIDGEEYTPGTKCPEGVKQETQNKWNTMNKIYSTKNGKKAIDEMDKEGVMYNVSSDKRGSGEGAYDDKGDGTGGTIYTNGNDNSIDVISHEVFHGYQDLNGQGGLNVPNEVEAYLFGAIIKHDLVGGKDMGMLGTAVQDPSVENYNKALGVFSNFSSMSDSDFQSNFKSLTSGFKQFSFANETGLYNNAPSNRPEGHTNLIRNFFK